MSLTCRTCLFKIEPDNCRDIFSVTTTGSLISEVLENFASIKIIKDDRLPNLLCASCEEKVNIIIDFRTQIITSDLELRRQNSFNSNEESIKIEPDCDPFDNQDEITIENHELFVSDYKKWDEDVTEDSMHDEEEKPFKCYECDQAFKNNQSLNSHNILYHSETGYKCEVCEKIFYIRSSFLEHWETHKPANSATHCQSLLPKKSRAIYEKVYKEFLKWCEQKNIEDYTENVLLAYFTERSKIYKASSLWSQYSMIRTNLAINKNIEINKFSKLIAFLKRNSNGFKSKKSKVLFREEIIRFIKEAPDNIYLMIKVALILGVAGACRGEELCMLSVDDIQYKESVLIVKLKESKTKIKRTFTVIDDEENSISFVDMVRKYVDLRPVHVNHRRFFINYKDGKCTIQPVGKNSFGTFPSKIANFLKLPEAEAYTGHCFRRSSPTFLKDRGEDILKLKRHAGWKSSVAESYVTE